MSANVTVPSAVPPPAKAQEPAAQPFHVDPDKLLYTLDEAAHLLSISRRTIFDLRQAGKLKAKRVGSTILFSRQELERFAKSGDVEVISGRGRKFA